MILPFVLGVFVATSMESISGLFQVIRPQNDEATARYHRGTGLVAEGKLDAAVVEFRAALKLKPEDPAIHIALGAALAGKGQAEAAIAEFRAAVSLKPDDATAHYNLGTALAGQGKIEDGVAEFRQALRLNPDNAPAHVGLGSLLANQGQMEAAIEEFHTGIRLQPDDATAHQNLGTALAREGQLDAAVESFRAALRIDPDDAPVHYNLGTVLAGKGRKDEAMSEFRTALRLKPDDPAPHIALGTALASSGDGVAAIAEFRAALKLRPDDAMAHYDLGIALLGEGQQDAALAEFRTALRLKPDDPGLYIGLGTALQGCGEFAEALDVLRKGNGLGTRRSGLASPSARWIEDVERLAALEARLPAIRRGADRPAGPAEAVDLARICTAKGFHEASADLYRNAFAQRPDWAEDLASALRYNAAVAAALAGAGRCKDDPLPTDQARARWRKQAIDWLQADLSLRIKQLGTGTQTSRVEVRQALQYWMRDPALAGLRDSNETAKLDEPERAAARRLWDLVESLVRELELADHPPGR